MILASRLGRHSSSQQFGGLCSRCFRKLYGVPSLSHRSISTTLGSTRSKKVTLRREYFSANDLLKDVISVPKNGGTVPDSQPHSEAKTSSIQPSAQPSAELPHRRRKRLKQAKETAASSTEQPLPPDASSRLSTLSSSLPIHSLRRRLAAYLSLSKPRLSFLIVLTTTASYAIYPTPSILSPTATSVPSLSPLILLFLTTGTALACSSANALNMLFEPHRDARMSRTRNRPLVRGLISKRGALVFAILTGTVGCAGLYYGVNPTVAALGFANIVLYAGVYTSLKSRSVLNTWAGALVGAIPPLMGWAAAAGQCATSRRSSLPGEDGSAGGGGAAAAAEEPGWTELLFADDGSSMGGWLLAALLFAWQFPHFNALSHTIREEYKAAGMRMMSWVSPRANARIAFRYSLVMFPICIGLSYYGVTDWGFAATSGVVNTWMAVEAWKFWRRTGERGTARGLFWASVWHLPIVLVLAMAQKKGLWDRVWRGVQSDEDEEVDADEDYGDAESHQGVWEVAGARQPGEI